MGLGFCAMDPARAATLFFHAIDQPSHTRYAKIAFLTA